MIDAMVAGRMFGASEPRTDKSGKAFAVAKVLAVAGDGDSVIVNVIAFDADVQRRLELLSDGDAVTLAGALTPKAWTDKQGNARAALDLVAHRMLSIQDLT
jgi:single-stranded DNA-binding protein